MPDMRPWDRYEGEPARLVFFVLFIRPDPGPLFIIPDLASKEWAESMGIHDSNLKYITLKHITLHDMVFHV
jgi:hypothetical protein